MLIDSCQSVYEPDAVVKKSGGKKCTVPDGTWGWGSFRMMAILLRVLRVLYREGGGALVVFSAVFITLRRQLKPCCCKHTDAAGQGVLSNAAVAACSC